MIAVRVPEILRDWLAPLLVARGLQPSEDAAVALAIERPMGAVRWLALCGDDCAAVAALDAGADDAVGRDAEPALMAARLARVALGPRLVIGELLLDPITRTASRGGRKLRLLPREYAVLAELARTPDVVVSRARLNAAIWARGFDPGTNVIEVHVSRLRAELDRGTWPMLRTERGRGYRLVSRPDAA